MSLKSAIQKFDGFQALTSGVDSGRSSYVLDRSQLAWLVNGTTRNNSVQCRPGIDGHALHFLDVNGNVDATLQTRFESGLWQGASPYESDSGAVELVVAIGGRIFRINVTTYNVTELTSNSLNSAIAPQSWFAQAEQYLVIQNGEDEAFVYDGASLSRSHASAQGGDGVPIGCMMAYNKGRLWVALPERRSFVAGDLAYAGKTGTRADVLGFTENTYLAGGGAFVLPITAGRITAMASIAQQDTVVGQGPLQVFTSRGCFGINAPFERTAWQTTVNPIETVSLLQSGATSQTSTLNVNGDLWYRGGDGVRSFAIAQRDHGTWVNTSLSREMSRAFDYDSPQLLTFSSAALFDNRLLVTTQPRLSFSGTSLRGTTHRALAVLDFAPVSSMLSRTSPVWDGIWTGLDILQVLVTGGDNPRCFIFALDSASKIKLWELSRVSRFDAFTTRIAWSFETPSYGFDTGGWNLRRLAYGDFWLNRIAGNIDYVIRYRVDADALWQDWHTGSACSLIRDCNAETCSTPTSYVEQYRARLRLPEPPENCDTLTGKPRTLGYRFATRVELTGFCSIPQLRLVAHDLAEDVVGGTCDDATCEASGVADTCNINDYSYSIT